MEVEKLVEILKEYKGCKIIKFNKGDTFYFLEIQDEDGKRHIEYILVKNENKDIKIV